MRGRNLLFLAILIAALFVPYFVSQQNDASEGDGTKLSFMDRVRQMLPTAEKNDDSTDFTDGIRSTIPTARRSGGRSGPSAVDPITGQPLSDAEAGSPLDLPAIGGPPVQSIAELLRWDATPQWILANWKQVSTRLAEVDLRGMRVPVVTGTDDDDVAGSLTYYFDHDRKVQRITLDGYTSDYRPIVDRLMQQHGLTHTPSLVNSLLVGRDNGSVNSLMRVGNARRMTNSGRNQYEILLELNRSGKELSEESRRLIEDGLKANLW